MCAVQKQIIQENDYKVLLFYGDKKHHKNLLSTLRFCGLRDIVAVYKLSEAIQNIISKNFDLIVATHFGEAAETTKFLEELKGHDATSDIPVLAYSEGGTVRDILRIMAKGVDEVLVEPISQEEVENKIFRVLVARRSGDSRQEDFKTAAQAVADGDITTAERIYRGFLEFEDTRVDALIGLSEAAAARNAWPASGEYLKKAFEMAKAATDNITRHRQLAEVFFRYGNFHQGRRQIKKALKSYRTALNLNPFHMENMMGLLQLLQKENELDEILKVVEEGSAAYPPFSAPLEDLALCVSELCDKYTKLSMQNQAKKLFQELIKIRHENPEVHLKAADYFMAQGEYELVVKNLMAVSSRIKDPDLLYKLGSVLLQIQGDHGPLPELIDDTGKGESLSPGHKHLSLAKEAFNQALLLDPDEPTFRLGLASCEIRLGQPEAADQVLAALKEGDNSGPEGLAQVIGTLLDEKAHELALSWLKDANSRFRDHPDVARLHARYHKDKGDPYEAIGWLKKALSLSGEDPQLILDLAEAYLGASEFSEAIFYFEKAKKLLPDEPRVKSGLESALEGKYRQGKR